MKTPYEEIIEKAFSVNQDIFSKNSQALMFGKSLSPENQELINKMNKIIGICIDVLISEFHLSYETDGDIVIINTENGTYSCPKNFIPLFSFVTEEDLYVTKEDLFEIKDNVSEEAVIASLSANSVLNSLNTHKEPDVPKSLKEQAMEYKELKTEPVEEIKSEPVNEASTTDVDMSTNEVDTTLQESTTEVDAVTESTDEIDFSQFYEEPVTSPDMDNLVIDDVPLTDNTFINETSQTTDTDSDEIDFSEFYDIEDTTETVEDKPNSEPLPIESTDDDGEIDFSAFYDEPEPEEFEEIPIESSPAPQIVKEETKSENKLLDYVNEPRNEKLEQSITPETVIEPAVVINNNNDEFEPERAAYNFSNTGLAHEGETVSTYTTPKDNIIYTVYDFYVIPGGIGNKEKISVMIAPLENRTSPDANVPIIVSALYNGKRFTKSSIETIDLGKNLITFDVVNYHFLVRGSFDENLKFKASINTTGKSIAEGTKILLINEQSFGRPSNDKYNGLHFTFSEHSDPTNCFVFPLKDQNASEFVCILQTKEFIDYPYCSKSMVGTEKIAIDNDGQRQELSCEWENNTLKAKLTEVTYG